ncbi:MULTISPECIES: ABC transporter substrate-binding protein [Caldimonas]|uniref:heme/hemin ABC transporter substrate-binding protein n=1 Tax=Caldimonas TaxID=196013 RepID=UPI0003604215|nr:MULTISPECIES: ABC transporter substrate-binding protein [Caldimonas]
MRGLDCWRRRLVAFVTMWAATGMALAAPARVVSLGGVITEIVHALGAQALLVGVDQSSQYPPSMRDLPQVGYYRNFSVEGVLSLKPDVVLASEHAGPAGALEQLRRLGLKVVVLPAGPTLPALRARIIGVADALDRPVQGRRLAQDIERQVQSLPPLPGRLRVLMLSGHTGRLQAAGRETAADALLTLAGGINVFQDHTSFKPVSAETVAALQPELIVTTESAVAAAGGVERFAAQPGIASTPAARQRRIVVMDDLLLLGFGPRLPQALERLRAGWEGR